MQAGGTTFITGMAPGGPAEVSGKVRMPVTFGSVSPSIRTFIDWSVPTVMVQTLK